VFAPIVREQRETHVAMVHVEQAAEVTEPDPKVRFPVEEFLTRRALFDLNGGTWHELRETDSADAAHRAIVELALQVYQPAGQFGVYPLLQGRLEDARGQPSRHVVTSRQLKNGFRAIELGLDQAQLATGCLKVLPQL